MIRLQCLEGRCETRVFEFDKDSITLGRSTDCDLALDDPACSRQHASIRLTDAKYYINDLGSTNGVRVNGQRVKEKELHYGDRFQAGKNLFVFLGDVPAGLGGPDSLSDGRTIIEKTMSLGAIDERLREIHRRAFPERTAVREVSQEEIGELQKANRQMHAIYSFSRAINSTLDPESLYEIVSATVFANFKEVERLCIFLVEKETGAMRCVKTQACRKMDDLPVSRAVLKRVETDSVGILATDALDDTRFHSSNTLVNMQVRSLMCVPLVASQKFLGAIYVENCNRINCFSKGDLELLTVLGNQAAVAFENALLHNELQVSFYEAIRSLGNALEAKDKYTRGHSQRVAAYAVGIGMELGLAKQQLENLRIAAELHDIGKIAIKEAIIQSNMRLTKEEFEAIKKHPQLGVEILQPISFLKPILPTILHHHERYNGKGYPDGLVGEAIPFEARILNLADAFDAMTSQRPYNQPRSFAEALEHCKTEAGVSFDARCVAALVSYITKTKGSSRGVVQEETPCEVAAAEKA
jgi:HD-GYP domain-containing protein (c-di-GMP phosphodiesterase class II)